MDATVLLADYAEAINGKLYIQGGGWDRYPASTGPVTCALAIMFRFRWDETNQPRKVVIRLMDQDGKVVEPQAGVPVEIEAMVEVGRPPGVPAGTELTAPIAVKLAGLPLEIGRYVFTIEVDGDPLGNGVTFNVV